MPGLCFPAAFSSGHTISELRSVNESDQAYLLSFFSPRVCGTNWLFSSSHFERIILKTVPDYEMLRDVAEALGTRGNTYSSPTVTMFLCGLFLSRLFLRKILQSRRHDPCFPSR